MPSEKNGGCDPEVAGRLFPPHIALSLCLDNANLAIFCHIQYLLDVNPTVALLFLTPLRT